MLKITYFSLFVLSTSALSFTVQSNHPLQQKKVERPTTETRFNDLLRQSVQVELFTHQQALDDFNYIKSNAAALMTNYGAQLKNASVQVDNKVHSLLSLIEKLNHTASYATTSYHSYENARINAYRLAGIFYMGEIRCQAIEIILFRLQIEKIIASEMTHPSLATQKAKRAFSYLKKMIKKEKELIQAAQATERDIVIRLLSSFKQTCGHVEFERTQTRGFVFCYTYFTELASVVKACRDKIHLVKNT